MFCQRVSVLSRPPNLCDLLVFLGMRSGNRKDELLLNGLRSEWITKWLDDIGLPQYKDQFYDARIDGRVLNHLTVVCALNAVIFAFRKLNKQACLIRGQFMYLHSPYLFMDAYKLKK